jgi:hypothetical protein
VGGGDHVDEAGAVQHAGRGDRIQPEHDEADHVGEQQHDAQRSVLTGMAPPQPADESEGDDEVGVVIKVGKQPTEQLVGAEPMVERHLDIDVQDPLEVKDPAAMGKSGAQPERRQVVDGVVQPEEPADDQDFLPKRRASDPGLASRRFRVGRDGIT